MTDKLKDAAEMALEALKEYTDVVQSGTDPDKWHEVVDGGAPARKAIEALRQALVEWTLDDTAYRPDGLSMPIDRGAWSDVPNATKWVDDLRGDEPDLLNQTCCGCNKSGGYALYCGWCWSKFNKS